MSKVLQYLTDERGEKTAVVLSLSDYEKLLVAQKTIVVQRVRHRKDVYR